MRICLLNEDLKLQKRSFWAMSTFRLESQQSEQVAPAQASSIDGFDVRTDESLGFSSLEQVMGYYCRMSFTKYNNNCIKMGSVWKRNAKLH